MRDTTAGELIRATSLVKRYGEVVALDGVSLSVRQGEFLALLGPSGCGKTTLLRAIAGFIELNSGDISIAGESMKGVPPNRRPVNTVFQNYALFPHLTIEENVAFPLSVRGINRAEVQERVRAALRMIKLENLAHRRPGQLSGGQQQRVALARALVFNPQLVLMDEPLGALDKRLREQMQLEIKQLHETMGITVVYVTHDQSEALTMSDRIAVFHQGRIQQLATPSELYERPANAFVASFIGENNRFDGTLVARDGPSCRVRLADGTELSATVGADLAPGAAVVISLRPEHVFIGAHEGANVLPAHMLEVIYLGDHRKLRMRVGGSDEFVAKVPAAGVHWKGGDALTVSWPANACLALPSDSEE